MSLSITESVQLQPYTTLGITATADYLIVITDPAQLAEAVAFAADKHLPIFPLGGGSNIVLGQERLKCVALKLEISGREIISANKDYTDVKVGAGENWDAFVAWSVEQGLYGIESLSLIPGTVGAAPVQNVGAYGQELRETLLSVEAYDIQTAGVVEISNDDCAFGYRDSMFKHAGKGRYIVTAVTFRLHATPQHTDLPRYATLQAELDAHQIDQPTLTDVREAVIAVRRSKLPDPAVTPTAGSFFHNPIVAADDFQHIITTHPDIPHWDVDNDKIKLSGAWLVEQCGFKGKEVDGVGIFPKQALALINPGHRPAADVLAFRDEIIASVKERFGVTLNMEPELVSF